MIENELYKSADDVLDRKCNGDTTQAAVDGFPTAPYPKKKIEKQVKVDEEEYSFPSKISKFKEVRLSVAFDDDPDNDLDVKARDVFQTQKHDSENACQYAIVKKSRKRKM